MMAKRLRLAILLLTGLQVAGCYTDYGPVEVVTRPVSLSRAPTHLQAGDKLRVTVYGEEALTGLYDVSPSGYVSMPLVGTIRAVGRTQSEFGRDISARYRSGGFLQD